MALRLIGLVLTSIHGALMDRLDNRRRNNIRPQKRRELRTLLRHINLLQIAGYKERSRAGPLEDLMLFPTDRNPGTIREQNFFSRDLCERVRNPNEKEKRARSKKYFISTDVGNGGHEGETMGYR